jgi:hypothetical protein
MNAPSRILRIKLVIFSHGNINQINKVREDDRILANGTMHSSCDSDHAQYLCVLMVV